MGEVYGLMSGNIPNLVSALVNSRQFLDRRWLNTVNLPSCGPLSAPFNQPPTFYATGQMFYHQVAAAYQNVKIIYEEPRIVLPPNTQFLLAHSTIATPSLFTEFWWTERTITAEELATG